jgi:hypothetical protein
MEVARAFYEDLWFSQSTAWFVEAVHAVLRSGLPADR